MAAENSGRSTFKAPPENAPLCVWVDRESTSGVRCFKRLLALELCGVCRFYERASLRARILFLVDQCDALACWHVAERWSLSGTKVQVSREISVSLGATANMCRAGTRMQFERDQERVFDKRRRSRRVGDRKST